MTPNQYLITLGGALALGMSIGCWDLIKESREVAKMGGRAFIKDRHDYLTVWQLAHELEGVTPASSEAESYVPEILRRVNQILQGFFRSELPLRKPSGYRVAEHRSWISLFFSKLDDRLWNCVATGKLDIPLLESLYVRRAEFLRFCSLDFIEPPSCWAPAAVKQPTSTPDDNGIEDNKDRWYEKTSDRRKTFIAGLEIAKFLWKEDPTRDYKDVFDHPLMRKTGFAKVFTFESFKKHAKPFASECATKPGRRAISKA